MVETFVMSIVVFRIFEFDRCRSGFGVHLQIRPMYSGENRRNDDGSVEITRLADHQRRHDLGRAGDERLVLRMGRIEDAPCGCVQ